MTICNGVADRIPSRKTNKLRTKHYFGVNAKRLFKFTNIIYKIV